MQIQLIELLKYDLNEKTLSSNVENALETKWCDLRDVLFSSIELLNYEHLLEDCFLTIKSGSRVETLVYSIFGEFLRSYILILKALWKGDFIVVCLLARKNTELLIDCLYILNDTDYKRLNNFFEYVPIQFYKRIQKGNPNIKSHEGIRDEIIKNLGKDRGERMIADFNSCKKKFTTKRGVLSNNWHYGLGDDGARVPISARADDCLLKMIYEFDYDYQSSFAHPDLSIISRNISYSSEHIEKVKYPHFSRG